MSTHTQSYENNSALKELNNFSTDAPFLWGGHTCRWCLLRGSRLLCVWAVPQRLLSSWWANANFVPFKEELSSMNSHTQTSVHQIPPARPFVWTVRVSLIHVHSASFPAVFRLSLFLCCRVCFRDQTRVLSLTNEDLFSLSALYFVDTPNSLGSCSSACFLRTFCLQTFPSLPSPLDLSRKRSFDWTDP